MTSIPTRSSFIACRLPAADNDSDAVAIICSVLGSFVLVLGAVAILAL
jgi:hypothetical protein